MLETHNKLVDLLVINKYIIYIEFVIFFTVILEKLNKLYINGVKYQIHN